MFVEADLYMPDMATLDAFFNKTDRTVTLSTVEQQKCEISSDGEKNARDAPRKRVRDSVSPAQKRRLKRKRQKRLDSNLNVSDHCTGEVDDTAAIVNNCQSCSQVEVHDVNESSIPSSGVEISYEEFLTSKGIVHIETSLSNSEDSADTIVDSEVKMLPVKASLNHIIFANHPLMKSPKKDESSPDQDECEGNSVSNSCVVPSKDIRSFFSKADKISPQPVGAAILMKIKAEVYSEQAQKSQASSGCTDNHEKTGSDLARRQRAAIVITDDDLDIEVIDDSSDDNDLQLELPMEDIVVSYVTESSASAEQLKLDAELKDKPLTCSEASLNADDTDIKRPAVQHDSVITDTGASVRKSVKSGRRLKLRATKSEEANDKADAHTLEDSVLCCEKVNSDCGITQCHKDECSDEVITVDEQNDKVACDNSSATEPNATDVPNGQCFGTLAAKLGKPKQVRSLDILGTLCINRFIC